MAAITTITAINRQAVRVRTGTAQATTGQTDWIAFPEHAKYATVYINLSAVAGNTPILTPSLLTVDPILRDDSYVVNLAEHSALTGLTGAATVIIDIGPGVTGIANDVTNAATGDSYVSLNCVLPPILGIKILNDRTSGDETYTYTVTVAYRG